MKRTIAIRHVHFEDLGTFARVLAERDSAVRYIDAAINDISLIDVSEADLRILLGGPIRACDDNLYPLLKDEPELLDRRVKSGGLTVGICFGAQLIAGTLGARVYPMARKEIGWTQLQLTKSSEQSALRDLRGPVLHWHGDTFDLPRGASLLAFSEACENQAFSCAQHILALQFHLEVSGEDFERWLIGHACELAAARDVSIASLRQDTLTYGEVLQVEGGEMSERLAGRMPSILKEQALFSTSEEVPCQNKSMRL
jgi:GMP synthase (glutamine-hydrolysing)